MTMFEPPPGFVWLASEDREPMQQLFHIADRAAGTAMRHKDYSSVVMIGNVSFCVTHRVNDRLNWNRTTSQTLGTDEWTLYYCGLDVGFKGDRARLELDRLLLLLSE